MRKGIGAMKVDIRPLLSGKKKAVDIDFTLTPDPIEGVEFRSDASVRGSVTDNAGYMRLALVVELDYLILVISQSHIECEAQLVT